MPRPGRSMRRDPLLLSEIIAACQRAIELAAGRSAVELEAVHDRRDALLWNFTVIGEAVGQLSDETKGAHPEVSWADPSGFAIASCTASGLRDEARLHALPKKENH